MTTYELPVAEVRSAQAEAFWFMYRGLGREA
jgi:hypothetical protein